MTFVAFRTHLSTLFLSLHCELWNKGKSKKKTPQNTQSQVTATVLAITCQILLQEY